MSPTHALGIVLIAPLFSYAFWFIVMFLMVVFGRSKVTIAWPIIALTALAFIGLALLIGGK